MSLTSKIAMISTLVIFLLSFQLWIISPKAHINQTEPFPVLIASPSPVPALVTPGTASLSILQKEETKKPSVGIIFFYHIPKCGGTTVAGIAGHDKFMDHLPPHYHREDAQYKIKEIMESIEENPRLVLMEQHSSADPQFTSMEWLISMRDYYRSQGYTFDIFIFIRDPIDYIVSTFNYYTPQIHVQVPSTFEEWMLTASNLQTNYIRNSHSPSAHDFYFRPWETKDGSINEEFSLIEFMKPFDDFLNQMDFVGFTSEMNLYVSYLNLRHNIPRKVSNVAVNRSQKLVSKDDITANMLSQFNKNNMLEYMLIKKARQVSSDRIHGYTMNGWNVDQTGTIRSQQ